MKNKIFFIVTIILINTKLYCENLLIEARDITLDKTKKTTVFENDVILKTDNKIVKSKFAEYYKEKEEVILKNNVYAKDNFNNIIETEFAKFNKLKGIFNTLGPTKLITSENYTLEGKDLFFDEINNIIRSDKSSILEDSSGNKIYLENFEYLVNENIFKSIGLIKIIDQLNNEYEFSQVYIDTKKKELLATDIKAFLKNENFKINKKNDPRIFANSMKLGQDKSSFSKSIFTLCEYKEGEKCPPWTLKAKTMTHDNKTKTIYYNNATVKVYDIPIFYFPYLSHPDPTVKRRSGFLPPLFSDSKNLGAGFTIPYFWALGEDKNFTLTNRIFIDENPLFTGEYHQAFKNSNFLMDFGFTEGYKKISKTKKEGDKSHFFGKLISNFEKDNDSESSLIITTQTVSDDKYLKLYKIKSNLADYNKDTLENSLNYTYSTDDFFLGINGSVYETLNSGYNDKYEYIFPEIVLNKNILNDEKLGSFAFQSNLKSHNYDTNRLTNFIINDLDWESNDTFIDSKIINKFFGKLRNINYEAKNVNIYKEDTTSEIFGAIAMLSKIDLQKKNNNGVLHLLTPKTFLRLSPGSMRKEESGSRLTTDDAFNIDRLSNINNFETGNSLSLGIDYEIKKNDLDKFNFSVAQIISEKENKKMGTKTSMDEKLSDLVGSTKFSINEKINFNHQFAIDQNYQEINYNDFGINFDFQNFDMNFNYIEEDKHIGNQEYFKTNLSYKNKDKSLIKFETKRNLITNSSEFYDLSYEYINDCLRAGLVYRREFYNDSELEAENSLMFNITLIPFGNINSPKINK